MNKDIIKKTVIIGIALVLVFVAFIPSVNSQLGNNFSVSSVQKEHTKDDSQEFVDNLDSKLNAEEATKLLPLETGNWWNDSWSYRKNITINHTKVDDDLSNFPVLISLPSDDDLASKAQNNGSDIVFTNYSGNKLNHEIELFNGSTGELVAWVNVTSLSSSVDTKIWIYYNNSDCSSQENIEGVWDSSYKLVQHLNETTGTHYDSTVFGNDGTPQNGVNQNAVGKVDGADEFDGSNDYVEVPDDDSLHQSNAISVEVWAKADIFGVWRSIAAKDKSGTSEWWFGYTTKNKLDFKFNGQTGFNINANTVITDSDWHHLVGVYNGSHIYVFVDGALDSTPLSYSDISTNTGTVNIGYTKYWNCCRFNGTIDEVRISNVARDSSWISTSYNNQNDPNTFYGIGSEEGEVTPPEITNVDANPDPQEVGGYVNISASVIDNVEVDEVYLYIEYPDNSIENFSITQNKTGDTYYCNKTYQQLGIHTYHIWANDSLGNTNTSAAYTFTIQDTTPPEILDNTPSIGYTGDMFTFNATVTDNVGVYEVVAGYWFGDGPIKNTDMNNTSGDYWEANIIISNSLDLLHYYFYAEDTSYNGNCSDVKNVTILDNDKPEIENVNTDPSVQMAGGYVNISAVVTDNINVSEVYLYILYPDTSIENFSITQNKTGDTYYYNRIYDQGGVHTFHIWANDTSSNSNVSEDNTFEIVLGDRPEIPQIQGSTQGKAGTSYSYTFSSTDPDGDDVYYYIEWGDGQTEEWIGPYESGEVITVNHTWDEKGAYTIKAKAKDTKGLESDWGTLEVTMPKNKQSTNSLFLWFLQKLIKRFPLLERILFLFPALNKLLNLQ